MLGRDMCASRKGRAMTALSELQENLRLGLAVVSELWNYKAKKWVTSIDTTDLDDYGNIEILAGSCDGRIQVLNREGDLRWRRVLGNKTWVGTLVGITSTRPLNSSVRIIAIFTPWTSMARRLIEKVIFTRSTKTNGQPRQIKRLAGITRITSSVRFAMLTPLFLVLRIAAFMRSTPKTERYVGNFRLEGAFEPSSPMTSMAMARSKRWLVQAITTSISSTQADNASPPTICNTRFIRCTVPTSTKMDDSKFSLAPVQKTLSLLMPVRLALAGAALSTTASTHYMLSILIKMGITKLLRVPKINIFTFWMGRERPS